MNSLVIGSTSQLIYYFPNNYEKISSRDINLDNLKDNFYDRIFFCFGEQRTFIENDEQIFIDVNLLYTLKYVDLLKDRCNKLILYSTSELWNNCDGRIDLNIPFNYNYSPYIKSKELLTQYIIENRKKYENIIILYPFNFNSIYRTYELIDGKFSIRKTSSFLFSKIFESLLTKKKIEIGDTYFYRDIIHPKYVVERSLLAEKDEIIGSGRLTFVNDFIRQLYMKNNLNYNDYVIENFDNNLKLKRKIYYCNSQQPKYTNLLIDTLNDIRYFQNKIS
jgi:nucleoside-diphosphate-sugar epimerase